MSGVEVIECVRAWEEAESQSGQEPLVAIGMSSKMAGDGLDAAAALKVGFSQFVSKPVRTTPDLGFWVQSSGFRI